MATPKDWSKDSLQVFGDDLCGAFDIGWGVGSGEEARFELRGGEVDAVLEAGVEKFREAVSVAVHGVFEVFNRPLGEVEAEHRANAVEDEGEAVDRLAGGGFKCRAGFLEAGPAVDAFHFLELGEASGHGDGISREGAGLVDWSVGREEIHDFGAPAERTHGESAADDLAHGGEVGSDAEDLLSAAAREAEAGHDLVKDENGAVGCAEGAQIL